MKLLLYSSVIGFACFCGCSGKITQTEEEKIQTEKEYTLEELPDKCFELDENTIQNTPYMQYIPEKGQFCFTNTPDNSIAIYDFNTGKMLKKIFFDKEGGNGVGHISSFLLTDSLIYLHHHWAQSLFITDTTTKVKKKISVDLSHFQNEGIVPPNVMPHVYSPLHIAKGKLTFGGFNISKKDNETKENTPATLLYDLKREQLELTNGYPCIYHEGNWGNNMRFVYYTFNDTEDMVVSYPASDSIFVNDLAGHIQSFYVGIPEGNLIKPIGNSRKPDRTAQRAEDEIKHYMANTVYGAIFYDKEQGIYYRIVTLPTPIDKNRKENPYNKKLQVVIFDKHFHICGVYDLPVYVYWSGCCFLSKEGLHIQVYSDNDDIMRFKTFKAKKIVDQANK